VVRARRRPTSGGSLYLTNDEIGNGAVQCGNTTANHTLVMRFGSCSGCPSSWMTYTWRTAFGSVAPLRPVCVAAGLTSSLPMIPSSHVPADLLRAPPSSVDRCDGPSFASTVARTSATSPTADQAERPRTRSDDRTRRPAASRAPTAPPGTGWLTHARCSMRVRSPSTALPSATRTTWSPGCRGGEGYSRTGSLLAPDSLSSAARACSRLGCVSLSRVASSRARQTARTESAPSSPHANAHGTRRAVFARSDPESLPTLAPTPRNVVLHNPHRPHYGW
jgi:hypothetical protein